MAWLVWRHAVDVPYYDQWEFVDLLERFSTGRLSLADLYAQHNESRFLVPRLLQLPLAWLTGWDVRYELGLVLLTGGALVWNLVRLAERTVDVGPGGRIVLGVATAALVFSLAAWETWLIGYQIAPLLSLTAFVVALRVLQGGASPGRALGWCAGLGVVSTFSFSGGVLFWPLIGIGLLMRPGAERGSTWWIAVWAGVGAGVTGLYLHDYSQPLDTPSLASVLEAPGRGLCYWITFLGSPLAGDMVADPARVALVVGCALLALLGLSAAVVLRSASPGRRAAAVPWLLVAGWTLGSAMLAAITRSGFGATQALASRYVTHSALLLVALGHLVPFVDEALAHHPAWRRGLRGGVWGAALVALVLHADAARAGLAAMQHEQTKRLRGRAGVLLIDLLEEDRLLLEVCPPRNDYRARLRHRVHVLAGLGFLRPGLLSRAALARAPGPSGQVGAFERSVPNADGSMTVTGWSRSPSRGETVDAVVLAVETTPGPPVPMAVAVPEVVPGGARARWEARIPVGRLPPGEVTLGAWVLDAESGALARIAGTHVLRVRAVARAPRQST